MPVNDPVAMQRLQAMAQGGTSSVAAWDAARAAAQAQQQQALGAVAPLALNGPAESAALSGIINKYAAPVNTAVDSGSAQAGRNDANYAVAGKSYLDRAMAKLEMEKQQNEQEMALKREGAAQDYSIQQQEIALKNQALALDALAGQRSSSRSSSPGAMSKEEVKDFVEGAAQNAMQEDNAAAQSKLDELKQQYINDQSKTDDLMVLDMIVRKANEGKDLSDAERRSADKIGQTYGVDVKALMPQAQVPTDQIPGGMSWDGSVPTFQGRSSNSSFSGAEGGQATNGPTRIVEPAAQLSEAQIAQRDAQQQALQQMMLQSQNRSGRMIGDTWLPSYVPVGFEREAMMAKSPGINAVDPTRQGVETQGWQPGMEKAVLEDIFKSNYLDLPQYQQGVAMAGGMSPNVARGMFPDTPKTRMALQKELDDAQDYADKQQVSDTTRETKAKKQAIDEQISGFSAELGMPEDRFKEILRTTNLPADKAYAMMADNNGQGSTDQQMKMLADQLAQEASAGQTSGWKNDRASDEFKTRITEMFKQAQDAGQIPEGLTLSDYLLLANQYSAILSGIGV